MKIVTIGTGNTATVLSKKFKAAGHSIIQVYGRNHAAAAVLGAELHTPHCSSWDAVTQEAELYVIAIADHALGDNQVGLRLKDQLVVHTAGAVSMETLKNISAAYGVFYPLQTLRKEIDPAPALTMLVDANSTAAKETLIALAKTIAPTVNIAGDAERMKYHLCAVMTNNFSNYLYAIVEDYCSRESLDFANLLPLIDETAARLHRFPPRMVQTGPAIRKDMATIGHHLRLLNSEPELKKVYQFFTDQLLGFDWK